MSRKILIVEDEGSVAGALSAKLQHVGFEVLLAGNGEEGFAKAQSEEPDLMLVDIVMPKMNGITMIKKLRAAGSTIPAIVLTNLDDKENISKAIEENCSGYLIKSNYSLEDVIEHINKTLKAHGK